jgi:hypothetical protein
MKYLVTILLIAVVAAGGYYAWQEPRVQGLFRGGPVRENPLDFLEDIPEPQVPEPDSSAAQPRGSRQPRTAEVPESTAPAPAAAPSAVSNQVPNDEVGRVLIQILRAQGLSDGISLSVTDEEVAVFGSVPSRERLQEIVSVIEKGRESRRITVEAVEIGRPEGE